MNPCGNRGLHINVIMRVLIYIFRENNSQCWREIMTETEARLLIAILLFGAFFAANQKGLKEAETVAKEIASEFEGFVDLQIFR